MPNYDAALYHGLFQRSSGDDGEARLSRAASRPEMLPCPTTGRLLRIATIEANTMSICPACANYGQGGFVSFVGDLRMAYACPQCREFIWLAGA
jgi:hypothetical protein